MTEYFLNGQDAKSKKINRWILNGIGHPSQEILSPTCEVKPIMIIKDE